MTEELNQSQAPLNQSQAPKRKHRSNPTNPRKGNTYGQGNSGKIVDGTLEEDVAPKGMGKPPVPSWRVSAKRASMLKENVAGTYASIGILVSSRDSYDGMVILSSAEARATELVAVASHNKRLFELLERVFTQGDTMKMFIGHGIMVYAIMVHHNRLPGNPVLLQQFGYTEAQLFAQFMPPTAPSPNENVQYGQSTPSASNGLTPDNTSSVYRTDEDIMAAR